jgi:hypothetical protein
MGGDDRCIVASLAGINAPFGCKVGFLVKNKACRASCIASIFPGNPMDGARMALKTASTRCSAREWPCSCRKRLRERANRLVTYTPAPIVAMMA